jgi:glutathione S-transferase
LRGPCGPIGGRRGIVDRIEIAAVGRSTVANHGHCTCFCRAGASLTIAKRRRVVAARGPPDCTAMITVHHLNNSRSQRVLWLLEELGVAYEIRHYARDRKTMLAPAALRQIHPLGKAPIITEDDRVVAESGAILEYLIERHGAGRLIPEAGTPERLRYTYWLHYAEGSAMPPLLLKLVFERLPKGPMPALVRPIVRRVAQRAVKGFIDPQVALHLDYMERELATTTWFAGEEFTGADIQMSFPLEAAAARGGLSSSRPRLWGFLERIHARPGYRRALEKGGAYELLR